MDVSRTVSAMANVASVVLGLNNVHENNQLKRANKPAAQADGWPVGGAMSATGKSCETCPVRFPDMYLMGPFYSGCIRRFPQCISARTDSSSDESSYFRDLKYALAKNAFMAFVHVHRSKK